MAALKLAAGSVASVFNVMGDRRRFAARRRGAAIAAAVAAHLLFLLGLMWSLGTTPRFYEPPVVSVTLVPPWPAPPVRARRAVADRPSPIVPRRAVAVPAEAPPPAILPLTPAPMADGARNALRDLVGCDHAGLAGLNEAERQRCRDRLAGVRSGDLKGDFGVAPAKRARFAADRTAAREPMLARTPKNGCRPRVQEKEASAPSLQPRQDWSGGITCAWDF